MGETIRRQIGEVHLLDGEDDDVTLIEQCPFVGEETSGCRAFGVEKRLLSKSEIEILESEETVPIQNRFEGRLPSFLLLIVTVVEWHQFLLRFNHFILYVN